MSFYFYLVMKPGYTLCPPRTANMPSTFASARNGYYSDIEHCVTRDSDFEDLDRQYERQQARRFLNVQNNVSARSPPSQLSPRPVSEDMDRGDGVGRPQRLDTSNNSRMSSGSHELLRSPLDPDKRSQRSHSPCELLVMCW